MAIRVYCEHNAFRDELHRLQEEGKIEIINFPYEQKITKKHHIAKPSKAHWEDLNVPWNKMDWTWEEVNGSEKLKLIREIIGRPRRDALHIDSAHKSGCKAFLTRDQKHIISKSDELESLLGIRFFHPDDQWEAFLSFLDGNIEDPAST
jgi:predicted HNH restriction endonuclease